MPRPLSRSTAVALLVAGTFFMENLDGTVITTALPQMAVSFGVHPVDLNIGVSAYLLTLAILIPASGWLADRFGTRSVFASAIVLFTVASALCGLSPNLLLFTLARVLQGIGGAMMVPVGRLAVLRTTEKHKLISAIATISWPGLAAPVLGPPVGGFLTTYASWHWIFFLNLPLGAIALVLALILIPAGGGEADKPFDWLGFLATGTACFLLMYGLDLVSGEGTPWVWAGACLLGALLVGVLAVLHLKRHTHPLVDLDTLRIPSYAVTVWGGSLFRIAIAAIPFLLPLLFQVGFGLSAFSSGLLVLAVFAGNLAMKSITTPIQHRVRFRTILLVNGTLNAVVIFACALLSPTTPVVLILALLFASGLTRSMQFTAIATLAFADVPESRMSGANTLFNMAVQLAMGMGVAVGAVCLRLAAMLHPAQPGHIPLADFRFAFVVVGCFAVAALFDVIPLDPRAGDAIRHGKPRSAPRAPAEADG